MVLFFWIINSLVPYSGGGVGSGEGCFGFVEVWAILAVGVGMDSWPILGLFSGVLPVYLVVLTSKKLQSSA